MSRRFHLFRVPAYALSLLAMACLAGCQTTAPMPALGVHTQPDQTLHPGDIVKIAFPAAPNLDTTQQVRRDGRINLYLVGEITAMDRTPADLQKELRQRYSTQLVSDDVTVTVVSSSFTVFVTGAVLRPGKISPERAITALEAIMEAGGFDTTRAALKTVVVIRTEEGRTQNVTLDLLSVLEGRQSVPFYLKSYDIVYVPEKFSFF